MRIVTTGSSEWAVSVNDDAVLYEVEGTIALITINRPTAANSLTAESIRSLEKCTAAADRDPGVRVIVLTSAGDGAFCAGADLDELFPLLQRDGHPGVVVSDPQERFFSRVRKPVIGAITGACIGGGVELALGCDLRVCDESASFALAEVRWGLVPVGGGTLRLPVQIPYAIAMEMLLTGRPLSAERALQYGLVNYVVRRVEVLATAMRIARLIAENSPRATVIAKQLARDTVEPRDMFAAEYESAGAMLAGPDAAEGVAAFRTKSKPTYARYSASKAEQITTGLETR
ncbi:enoyl-CoA hydratase [Rhodococcus opacus]|nr:enoyl-CoA hydratase [Rhodococcus opacus]